MTIYSSTNYRKIYKRHYGEIPKDDQGRRYDIHHKDGNKQNNDPSNLIAVSIQEHYDIHYAQGDYGACYLIAARLDMPPDRLSDLASKRNKQQLEAGTHVLLGGEIGRAINAKRVADGTHQMLGGKIQREWNQKGLADGTHPGKVAWICPHCSKNGVGKGNFTRYHNDNCRSKLTNLLPDE